MLRSLWLFAVLFLAFAALAFSGPASAQQTSAPPPGATKAAVLDVERILRESAAMKNIRKQIVDLRNNFQQELQANEEVLRQENQELAKKRTILAPEAFAAERQAFEQKVAESRRGAQQRGAAIDQANTNAVLEVQKVYNAIVGQLSQERGFGLIFRKSSLVIAAQHMEITADVLARLDTALPSVTLEVKQPQ